MTTLRYDFEGLVAVVTGGASGIGLAIARRLARSNAAVAAWDVADAGDIPGVTAISCDVSDEASVAEAMRRTVEWLGTPTLLVNAAGVVTRRAPLASLDLGEWDRTFDIDLRGVVLVTRAALPQLLGAGGGAIVNIASMTGLDANAGYAAYSAAKAGLVNLTHLLAKEYGGAGIRSNAVAPGMVETPLITRMDPAFIAERTARSAAGRLIRAEEVAAAVLWLLSEEASFVNGITLPLTGGRL